MKKRLLFSFVLLYVLQVGAQLHKIDSLLNVLKTQKEDSGKADLLNELSRQYYIKGNYKKSDSFARRAIQLSEKINYKIGLGTGYLDLGNAYANRGDYSEALKSQLQSLKIFEEIRKKQGMANAYGNIGNIYKNQSNYPEALKNEEQSLTINEEIGNALGKGNAYCNIGQIYELEADYPEALKNLLSALKIFEDLGNNNSMSYALGNLGNTYFQQGNYPEALKNLLQCLRISEKIGNKGSIGNSYSNIGNVYEALGNYSEALQNHLQSLKIDEEIGNKSGVANSYTSIGNIYTDQSNYPQALKYMLLSLKMNEEIGNKYGMSVNYGSIGNIYFAQGNTAEALKNEFLSLKLDKDIENKNGIGYAYGSIGTILIKTGELVKAKKYFDSAMEVSVAIGAKELIRDTYYDWASSDSALASSPNTSLFNKAEFWKEGLNNYKTYIIYRDSLKNKENDRKIVSQQMTYNFEKKADSVKAEQDKKDLETAAKTKRQNLLVVFIAIIAIAVGCIAIIIFRSLRITRKQKELIEEQKTLVEEQKLVVEKQKDEVEQKNVVIEFQKKVVEEKNKDILDSITYAKRLQDAILPPLSIIKKYLPESFLLYKPKDIVAGDFYWMEREGDVILIAAADCTGHGVPGALVSVVCSNALNRAFNEFRIRKTSLLLDKVRELVLETFRKSEGQIQDGMDISFCAINTQTNTIEWSGAYNPLWYIQNNEIKEIKADNQPIGKTDNPVPFNSHSLTLDKGDCLYLFTDGYADQFGGDKGKKFKYKQLQELLLTNSHRPMEEQGKILDETITSWKGELEQTDDVCVIGIRI